MADCPDFKKTMTSSLKQKRPVEKKVYKVTWDSESESEDEVDTANVCFMANTPKVHTKTPRRKERWYLDSGCSRHMTWDINNFTTLSRYVEGDTSPSEMTPRAPSSV